MVNATIDGRPVSVPEGTTIIEAAKMTGIPIPKLCYLKGINEIGACRICVVEIEGKDRLVTSCNNTVEEGMVIYTNSPKVRQNRKTTVELIMSQHNCHCATCLRNGNCSLQKIVNDLNIMEIPFHADAEHPAWNQDFPLIRDASKCIKCMRCIQVCGKIQGLHIWDLTGTGSRTTIGVSGNRKIEDADCSLCGQCITHCPTAALRARDDTEKVWNAIESKDVVTVVQIAPAVRAAWGEELGINRTKATVGKIVDSLKRIGFDYVFDTTFSADLTIMEEGREFVERFRRGETRNRPMFTSCCPGWIRFLKSRYPHLVPQLSTAKSPQQMFGAVMKTYFAEHIGVKPENIVTVSIMPCTAKKGEANMELFYEEYAGHDIDYVLTTRELVRMIRSAHIQPDTLTERECDRLMRDGTGAGVIFGTTGGVMEAALRSAHYLITGKNPSPDAFYAVRGDIGKKGWTESVVRVGDAEIAAAVVSGLGNTRMLLEAIESG
ncbi:MAG: (2Fe-2S)-binding protein, partial [Lachnospiraceae bacterium]|nr:(2Fe-2S)-binding protein [Lachnospiraceae bacterium]